MNTESLFLFLILLLGLVLCSFLGGNCDYQDFNTYEGLTTGSNSAGSNSAGSKCASTSGAATSPPVDGVFSAVFKLDKKLNKIILIINSIKYQYLPNNKMSVILNNNHNFDHLNHLNNLYHLDHFNQRIRCMNIKYSLPKRLDIKITSTDTNILYQYLSLLL